MSGSKPHVLLAVDATAFVGNDRVACRTHELSTDSANLMAPTALSAGTFVRLQCHLDSSHWLDVDAVLTDCRRAGPEWHWHLSFVSVKQPAPAVLELFLRQHDRPSAPVHGRPEAARG